jgi:hypothetical protein
MGCAHITIVQPGPPGPNGRKPMRLLRTAAAGFVNAEKIVSLGEEADGWVAILEGGEEVALARYYSAPGRVERELPDLVAASRGTPAAAWRAPPAARGCGRCDLPLFADS